MLLRLRNVEREREKKKSLSLLPPLEFQTLIHSSKTPDTSLLGDPGLLINIPKNAAKRSYPTSKVRSSVCTLLEQL